MSKFKNEVKATWKDFKDLYKHDWHDFGESMQFYKQAFRDFAYATKLLFLCAIGVVCLVIAPLLIPVAVLIRLCQKGASRE
jgi:hypothetical protein